MQNYTYRPESDSEYDIEICNKKNEIEKLREEIKRLELKKSKLDKDYIGRAFKDKYDGYLYVTHTGFDGKLYCLYFDFFENEVDIKSGIVFDETKIKEEISMFQLRNEICEVSKFIYICDVKNK